MTTETPAPLDAFRTGRDSFLNNFMAGVSGLEEAVLYFEHEHQRRTSAAEAEAAGLRRKVENLTAELGQAAEDLEAAGKDRAEVDDSELVEARETIRLLREEAELQNREKEEELSEAARNADALRLERDAALAAIDEQRRAAEEAGKASREELEGLSGTAAELENLRRDLDTAREDLDTARETISEMTRAAEEARSASSAELLAARTSWQDDRASLSGSNARLSEELLSLRKGLQDRVDAVRAAASAEAVRVLAAVAADSPDVPLSEALDLVTIAMDIPEQDLTAVQEDISAVDDEAEQPAESADTEPEEINPESDVTSPEPEPAKPDVETVTEAAPKAPHNPMLDEGFFATLQAPVVLGAGVPAPVVREDETPEPLFAPTQMATPLILDEEETPTLFAPAPIVFDEDDSSEFGPEFDLGTAQEEIRNEESAAKDQKSGFSLFGRNAA